MVFYGVLLEIILQPLSLDNSHTSSGNNGRMNQIHYERKCVNYLQTLVPKMSFIDLMVGNKTEYFSQNWNKQKQTLIWTHPYSHTKNSVNCLLKQIPNFFTQKMKGYKLWLIFGILACQPRPLLLYYDKPLYFKLLTSHINLIGSLSQSGSKYFFSEIINTLYRMCAFIALFANFRYFCCCCCCCYCCCWKSRLW